MPRRWGHVAKFSSAPVASRVYDSYDALCKYGTDFTLIAAIFPNRDRTHIKKKFKKVSLHARALPHARPM